MNLEGVINELTTQIDSEIKKADIKSEEKEFVENTIRMDMLNGAYYLAKIQHNTELAKEIKRIHNQILEKTF